MKSAMEVMLFSLVTLTIFFSRNHQVKAVRVGPR